MKVYVLGLAFTLNRDAVVLILKERPDWQKGLYNGVGGKVESGETTAAAMSREFLEETGVRLNNWSCFASFSDTGGEYVVHVFKTFAGEELTRIRATTDEVPSLVDLENLPHNTERELHWLIPLALAENPAFAQVRMR